VGVHRESSLARSHSDARTVWNNFPSVLIEGRDDDFGLLKLAMVAQHRHSHAVVIAPTRFWLPYRLRQDEENCFNERRADFDPCAARQDSRAASPFPNGNRPRRFVRLGKCAPTMTASAPQASALQTSPPLLMPPSVMIEHQRAVFLECAVAAQACASTARDLPTSKTNPRAMFRSN